MAAMCGECGRGKRGGGMGAGQARTIGELVRAEREARGWSRDDLLGRVAAHGVTLDAETLGRIERNETLRPQEATLDALIAAFGPDPERRRAWRAAAARPDR